MLVKTPAIKLAVEIRSAHVEDDRLTLTGVASNMPCSVQIGGRELRLLVRMMFRRRVLNFVFRSLIKRVRKR